LGEQKYIVMKKRMSKKEFDAKIEETVHSLRSASDYTDYHVNHILAVCYHQFFNAPIKWVKNNHYPVPQFDMKKGYQGNYINPELIVWTNHEYFYHVNKHTIEQAMKDSIVIK
jgi:hypothetical protein